MRYASTIYTFSAFLLFGLLALVLAGEAEALRPPPAIVMLQDNVTLYPPPTNPDSRGNLTWMLSPDDPDQINGALTYSLYINRSTPGTYTCGAMTGSVSTGCGWQRLQNATPGDYLPIPGRPGWVKDSLQFSFGQTQQCTTSPPDYFACGFNMTAWQGTGESYPSCQINVTIHVQGGRDQCGGPIMRAPAGVAARVTTLANATAEGTFNVTWSTSPDDLGALGTEGASYADQSPAQNVMVVQPGNVLSSAAAHDSAYGSQFNGAFTGTINVTDSTSIRPTCDWSFGAWVKPGSVGVIQSIMSMRNANGNLYMRANGSVEFLWAEGPAFVDLYSSTILSAGVYYHVAATYDCDTTTGRLYINGSQEDVESGGPGATTPTSFALNVGHALGTLFFADGAMDDVLLANRTLSAPEVVSAMAGAQPSNVVGWFPFEATPGNFSYRFNMNATGPRGPVVLANLIDHIDSQDGATTRGYLQTFGGTANFLAIFTIRAEDSNGTLQFSNYSCAASVNSHHVFEANGCGVLALGAIPGSSGPAFPLLNVSAFATGLGVDTTAAGWVLAGVFVFALVIAGFTVGGGAGAAFGAVGGLSAVVFLALLPGWLLIVLFILVVGAAVALFAGGSGGASS